MSDHGFAKFFRRITHAVMALLLVSSVLMCRSLTGLTAAEAMRAYHSYPYMFEHILCGLAAYLVFSVAVTKIHRSSLHDGGNEGQK